jgi:hypothetical protein
VTQITKQHQASDVPRLSSRRKDREAAPRARDNGGESCERRRFDAGLGSLTLAALAFEVR